MQPCHTSYRQHFHTCYYVYVYIYMLWESIFWPSFTFFQSQYFGQVCFFSKTIIVKKHCKNRGFNTIFKKKKNARQNFKVNILAKLGFFWDPQLGQNIDFENGHFFIVLLSKKVLKYLFLNCFLNFHQNLPTKMAPKKR